MHRKHFHTKISLEWSFKVQGLHGPILVLDLSLVLSNETNFLQVRLKEWLTGRCRMSLSRSFEAKYPWLSQDLFSSNLVAELIAKHLNTYLHFLSALPGSYQLCTRLGAIQSDVFQLLVNLRRPTDQAGTRWYSCVTILRTKYELYIFTVHGKSKFYL